MLYTDVEKFSSVSYLACTRMKHAKVPFPLQYESGNAARALCTESGNVSMGFVLTKWAGASQVLTLPSGYVKCSAW